MRTSTVIVSLIGITLVAGAIHHFTRKQVQPAYPSADESVSARPIARPSQSASPAEEPPFIASPDPEPAREAVEIPATTIDVAVDTASGPNQHPTPFSQAIDTLVSEASFQQKQAAWKQLRDAGQLELAIDALRQGASENPGSAEYPAALGQALLYRAGEIAALGGTISEMGILGMQADQSFDAALNLDPTNWEAQFFKATAMSHWPLELNRGEEVIQRLSSLIDQQQALVPEPQFAQAYVALGDQYERMGQPDHAAATWLIGARLFPGNPDLQHRIQGH
jgi:hypothetical protein